MPVFIVSFACKECLPFIAFSCLLCQFETSFSIQILFSDAMGRSDTKGSGRCKEDEELAPRQTWFDYGDMYAYFSNDPSPAGLHRRLEMTNNFVLFFISSSQLVQCVEE